MGAPARCVSIWYRIPVTVNDKVSREREFALGEQVLVQNFQGKPQWLNGTVAEQTVPVSYKVLVGDQLWKRHVDQMHQQRGSQIDHAKRNANVSLTPPNVGRNQDVVDVPAITSPQSETAEVAKKEPISEPGTTQPQPRNLKLSHAIQRDSERLRSA